MTRTNPKPAHCEKCNSSDVAWFKSKKTGKWYLCEVFTDNEGDRITSNRDFHSKYCGNQAAHDTRQAEISGESKQEHKGYDDEYAQTLALNISNLDTVTDRVLSIADTARNNRNLAGLIAEIWRQQGEILLADVMDGALGREKID